jgi:uncharacterized membrane protein HdeD (DUF308 family)
MIGLGLLAFLAGLILLVVPEFAADLFAVFAGIAIIMLAAIVMVEGLFIDSEGISRWGVLILGLLGILLGLLVIAAPSLLVIAAGLALGLFLITYGIVEAVIAYLLPEDLMIRMALAVMAVFATTLGILIVLRPITGIDMILLLTGLYLIVLGMMRIAHGITERHAEQTVPVKRL